MMEPKDMCEARRRAAESLRMSVNGDEWLDVAVAKAIGSACGGFKAKAFGDVLAELMDNPTCTMDKTDSYKTESGETVNVWECSNCGEIFFADWDWVNHPIDWSFCPNCGAEVVRTSD